MPETPCLDIVQSPLELRRSGGANSDRLRRETIGLLSTAGARPADEPDRRQLAVPPARSRRGTWALEHRRVGSERADTGVVLPGTRLARCPEAPTELAAQALVTIADAWCARPLDPPLAKRPGGRFAAPVWQYVLDQRVPRQRPMILREAATVMNRRSESRHVRPMCLVRYMSR
jgi:hypothetical protein